MRTLIFFLLIVCFSTISSCKKDLNVSTRETMRIISGQKIGEVDFDATNFTNSTLLTNKYVLYQTGTTYVFEGETADGHERNEIKRIEASKVVMGINVAVISDKVWLDGILEEDTRDWFAQDDSGNVWYMGEDVDNYNPDGTTIRDHAGSWEAGVNGAKAGIIMLVDPKPGNSYPQEFAAGIAEDEAKIEALGLTIKVPFNTYSNCLKTKEWTDLEKGSIDFKYYAPGIGLIMEKKRNEISVLVDIN